MGNIHAPFANLASECALDALQVRVDSLHHAMCESLDVAQQLAFNMHANIQSLQNVQYVTYECSHHHAYVDIFQLLRCYQGFKATIEAGDAKYSQIIESPKQHIEAVPRTAWLG